MTSTVTFVADGLLNINSGLATPIFSAKVYSGWEKLTTIAVERIYNVIHTELSFLNLPSLSIITTTV